MVVQAGIAPADFWRLTPYQTRLALDARRAGEKDDLRALVAQAWHTANLTASASVGRLPRLDEYDRRIFGEDERPVETDPGMILTHLKKVFA